jgi:hypothetical protein
VTFSRQSGVNFTDAWLTQGFACTRTTDRIGT